MNDWFTPEHTVVISIVVCVLAYFLSFRLPNYAQGHMLRTAAVVIIICSIVLGWAVTDSFIFGFWAFSGGFLPILIYHLNSYFKTHPGLFGNSVGNDISPANFQFSTKKLTPKVEVEAKTELKQPVDESTKDTGE